MPKLRLCSYKIILIKKQLIYSCGNELSKIKEDCICTMKNILKYFRLNSWKANPGKFQFMILSDKHISKINLTCVQSCDDVTVLRIIIDTSLTFKKQVGNLVHKTQNILHALRCIRNFFTVEKAKLQVNALIDSQFSYSPLIWMFCRKTFYPKIEKIYHQTLKWFVL